MSYITTYGGIHFDPLAPRPEQILAEDIAHALSLICRGNGHVRRFYSVAQHSLACSYEAEARGLSARVRLACLLHDAAEAYLSDVTRPVKTLMPQLRAAEDRLLDVIWRKFLDEAPDESERALVFEIDDDMLSYEFHVLMPEDISDRWRKIRCAVDTRWEEPARAAARFEKRLRELWAMILE
ncbi:phosphohydrolase [Pyramidobacter sp.]|uniref:phosphohydrolase n=1 Tax=Pyramidobacter sp. TaxID=1943581 RepID=UPI0025FB5F15|nr:phosphohydrolase [Pyramidobacter sp.]MCI7402752.1 phosphohydrolase [Pyramidobacter sp.]MDY3211746.1 phosphohydrolase [Pyramidobacter sp.]